ncbi:MAG: hypothetical protein LUG99_08465 [Lachnospiraceae bacterium]|nr:hypothetical protein [Lachnospiraceae bacterium]
MKEKDYEITLSTPIGKRRGMMKLNFDDGKIAGVLSLFENCETVSGFMDSKGDCSLWGSFRTLKNSFYYKATGKINDEGLDLVLYGEKHSYRMTGTAVPLHPEG